MPMWDTMTGRLLARFPKTAAYDLAFRRDDRLLCTSTHGYRLATGDKVPVETDLLIARSGRGAGAKSISMPLTFSATLNPSMV